MSVQQTHTPSSSSPEKPWLAAMGGLFVVWLFFPFFFAAIIRSSADPFASGPLQAAFHWIYLGLFGVFTAAVFGWMRAQQTRNAPRQRRKNAWIAALLFGACALMLFVMLPQFSYDAPWLEWARGGAFAVMAVASFGWIGSLDEAAKLVHFRAWYWGGSLGLCLSWVGLAMIGTHLANAPEARIAELDFKTGLVLGFLLALLPAVLIYMVWWSVLWLRRG